MSFGQELQSKLNNIEDQLNSNGELSEKDLEILLLTALIEEEGEL